MPEGAAVSDSDSSSDSSTDSSSSWSDPSTSTTDAGSTDSTTETTHASWFSRLGNALIGALVGLVMIAGSCALLYWNENRAVIAIRALDDGLHRVVPAKPDAADPALEGKLVHVSGPLNAATSARDPQFEIRGPNAIRLRRTVEMYQWKEDESTTTERTTGGGETKRTTYSYSRTWSETPISSANFRVQGGHQNPPMAMRSQTFDSPDAVLGAYRLDSEVLRHVTHFQAIPPNAVTGLPDGFQRQGDILYRGADMAAPRIGDLRVHLEGVAPQTYSVVAAQMQGVLTPDPGRAGYTIALAHEGTVPAERLFQDQKDQERLMTWVLRGVGFVVMLLGFVLFFNPLAVLVGVLPFLESIVGAGLFFIALMLAVPLTLVVIAISWLVVRPLVGGGLLAAALVALVLLFRRNRNRAATVAMARPRTA